MEKLVCPYCEEELRHIRSVAVPVQNSEDEYLVCYRTTTCPLVATHIQLDKESLENFELHYCKVCKVALGRTDLVEDLVETTLDDYYRYWSGDESDSEYETQSETDDLDLVSDTESK